jgi:hypothetical protein
VYVESTIPSYLVARPSRDLVTAGHQQITHAWWEHAAERFELYVAEAVLDEIGAGDPTYAAERLAPVANLPISQVLGRRESVNPGVRSPLGACGRVHCRFAPLRFRRSI